MTTLRIPRTSQPQTPVGIDPSFTFFHIANGNQSAGVQATLTGTASYGVKRGGRCTSINAAGDYISHGTDARLQLSKQSGVIVVQVGSLSTAQSLWTTCYTPFTGLFMQITTTGQVEIDKHNVSLICVSSNTVTPGSIARIAWSYESSTGLCAIGVNGVVTTATAATTLSHGEFVRGRYGSSNTLYSNPHDQYLYAVSPNTRSPAEIKSLSDNPWQIFQPVQRAIYVGEGAVVLETIGRPVSDTSAGAWVPSSGGNLYAMIDEVAADEGDYISVSSLSTCEVQLNNTAFPGGANQVLRYRAKSATGNGVTVTMKQGATTIASWSHALTSTITTYTQTLTAPQIAAIVAGPISVTLTST